MQLPEQPLVTIVTPSYNSAEFIEETIQSVLNQTYPNIEYIIMDGGSTDGTLAILEQYRDQVTVVSEPDNGQSDAINKGWKRAKGEIVAWLCADDLYLPDTVEKAVDALQAQSDKKWVYGRAKRISRTGEPLPFRAPTLEWSYQDLLEEINFITQPTVFLQKLIIEQKGYLREDLHYAMDYEYWLRIGQDFPPIYIDSVMALVRNYAETKSASGGFARLREYEEIMETYGATELVRGYRYFWTRSYLDALAEQIKQRNWQATKAHIQSLYQYPAYIPRAIVRKILDSILSTEAERRLRLLLLKER